MTSCGCNFLMHIKNNQPQPAGLNKSNYYPYPELENPKNPYGSNVEKYNCNTNNSLDYLQIDNKLNANYSALKKIVQRENYSCASCPTMPYSSLNKTWQVQQDYNL
jgi:hypothetical protein